MSRSVGFGVLFTTFFQGRIVMGRSNVTKVIFGLSIVAAVLFSEAAQAEITTVGYWQMGENDPRAAGLSGASQTIASVGAT